MNEFNTRRATSLEKELKKQQEMVAVLERSIQILKNKSEETKVLIKFHKEIALEATKSQSRKEYKAEECSKCALGKYGGCESGYKDVLDCKSYKKTSKEI